MTVQIIDRIMERAKKLDDARIFFVLRQMHTRFISANQIQAIKIFLVLREFGTQVVPSSLFLQIYGTTQSNTISMLHRLGDKGIITMVKNEKPGVLRYLLSEKFVSLWTSQPTNLNT